MTAQTALPPSGFRHAIRRAAANAIFAMLAAIMFLVFVPSARANVILNYQFSPDTSITLPSGIESVSGTFAFDVTLGQVVSAAISISGPYLTDNNLVAFGCSSIFTHPGELCVTDPEQSEFTAVLFVFDHSLADGVPDALVVGPAFGLILNSLVQIAVLPDHGVYETALSVTGEADLEGAPAPEPGSFALLGAGLIGLNLARRRKNA